MRHADCCGATLLLVAFAAPCLAQTPNHVAIPADSVRWGPASPKLPPGAQFAILMGDPARAGEPYVFRAKLPDGYSVPPHWHPVDENVTVISGVFMLGTGRRFDRSRLQVLGAGSYVLLKAGEPHYNVVKGQTILQFHGVGPYDITYVDPLDQPRRPTSRE